MNLRTAHASLAALALAAAACTPSFVPGSVLTDLRVLALAPEPPTAAAGETVTVTPTVYRPGGEPVTETWTFCPLTTGPGTAYACVSPLCEVPLTPGPDGRVTADPAALALQCLQRLGGTLPGEAGGPGTLPDQVETVFRYRVEGASGPARTAVARVPLYTGTPPADRNLAPVIASVEIAGATAAPDAVAATARPGEAVPIAVQVDPASYQTYRDASGRTLTEQVIVSFFTTAGRFPDGKDRDDRQVSTTQLELRELAPDDAEAELWVVARDLRGGQAVAGPFRVAIQR